MSSRRLHPLSVVLVAVAAFALAGCPDDVEPPPEEPGDPPPEAPLDPPPDQPGDDLTAECTNPDGFAVSYPGDWVTNEDQVDELPPCSLFDPEAVEFDETLHVPEDIAVFIQIDPVEFDPPATPEFTEVLSRDELSVDGRDALRIDVHHTGAGMLPEGAWTTSYRVDLGEETLVASSHDIGEPPTRRSSRCSTR